MEQTVLTQNDTLAIPKKAKTLRVMAMVFLGIYAISGFFTTFASQAHPNFYNYREILFILGFLCLLPICCNKGIKIASLTMILFDLACLFIPASINKYLYSGIFAVIVLIFIYIYSLYILNANIELNNKRWINLIFILMMPGLIMRISDAVIYMPIYEKFILEDDTHLWNIIYGAIPFTTIGNKIFNIIIPILWFVVYYKLCFSSLFCGIYDKDAKPVLNPFNKQVIGAIAVAAVDCGLLWLVFANREPIMDLFL